MVFPERFSNLPEYAFPRLRNLLDAHEPGGDVLHLSIGQPKHAFPDWVAEGIAATARGFQLYPPNDGAPELLAAISSWLSRRYGVQVPVDRIMALNGSREGLFNTVLALCPEAARDGSRPAVLVPNPFYQVYAVGALTLGAEPIFVSATEDTGFLPDYAALPTDVLNRTEVAFVCSPGNPQGAVATRDYWAELLALAEHHDFRIIADECYCEIYRNAAPAGLIEVAEEVGADPERAIIIHSLSKRSNLAGLRSGFVAAGPESMRHIRRLRAYSGAPVPLPIQRVSERLWADEDHVEASRTLYQQKYDIADAVFAGVDGCAAPEGGFFLWLPVDDGEAAALKLWQQTGIRVLPGAYLARETTPGGGTPGDGYIRVAMVAPTEDLQHGLTRLRDCLYT
ncbi:MAG: aminotransferase class I/II-fold pyridoxal phosphate-dependent enzyme [Rhodobacteraceae bacterium]|nr:aminotransferase class I/II-fold pyridoxal phosphate-dependent enzyme [Paracoccaceae bacterium]